MTLKIKLMMNKKWYAYRTKRFERFKSLKNKIKSEIFKAKKNWTNGSTFNARGLANVLYELTQVE